MAWREVAGAGGLVVVGVEEGKVVDLQLGSLGDVCLGEELAVLEQLGLHVLDALLERGLLGLECVDLLSLALT